MEIKYAKIFVDNQDKALKFSTKTLGFVKKGDISNEGYRWLTVVSPDYQNGTELILELNSNPAAEKYQKAMFEQNIPAINFVVSDVYAESKRLKKLWVKFTTEAVEVMEHVIIAVFNDTCGNLIQIQKTGG